MKYKSCFACVLLIFIFMLIRFFYQSFSPALNEIDIQGMGIISLNLFPIIKQTTLNTGFLPLYYIIAHFVYLIFKSVLSIKIFNSIIALLGVIFLFKIAKKNFSLKMGLFLFLFLSVNHFYCYYTSLIAPYCLNFLIFLILLDKLIDFIKKPSQKTVFKLSLMNFLYILTDSFGFLFIFIELGILYLILSKKEKYKKIIIFLIKKTFLPLIIVSFIFLIQIYIKQTMLIPINPNAIALNLNGLYLLVNEFISPYLSFDALKSSNTTLGMLYTYFLNPDIKNINSLKILITLFYSSILPLCFGILCIIKTILKKKKYRIIFSIGVSFFLFCLILFFFKFVEIAPIYLYQSYFIFLILFAIGLFEIKDVLFRGIIIFCLFLIQFVNPNLNTFNITINKSYPVNLAFDSFIKEYQIKGSDLIISPYLSKYMSFYYKDLTFFDFDYSYFKRKGKDGVIENLLERNSIKPINKKNIYFLSQDYLLSGANNDFFAKKFFDDYLKKDMMNNRIILVVDKLNTRPVLNLSINKFANLREYNLALRKIDFENIKQLNKNTSKQLYDALCSKALYNIIYLLNNDLRLLDIVEYKLIDGKIYRVLKKEKDIYRAINSYQNDYVFAIYQKRTFY